MGLGRARATAERFQAFVAENRDNLVSAARKMLDDPQEAEDVVQETLSAVWERLPAIRIRRLDAYVFRAVQFNALKRRARRRKGLSLNALPVEPEDSHGEDDEDEISPVDLEEALLGLPPTQQVVLRMKYYLGLTFREIGGALSISANTASSRCRYALAALRRVFGAHRKSPSDR